jgi:ABC-type iron transport system FetAB ATPase subunit
MPDSGGVTVLAVNEVSTALLKNCTLSVSHGELVTLRGASGSGKTLLLRAIADLDPNRGDVVLDDTPRSSLSGPEWRRRVRYVAAEPAWWADDVGANFRNPRRASGLAMEVGLPADCMSWQVARLSTGERQRLGLLRAMEDNPRVLLLDEPTAALDEDATRLVERLIVSRKKQGTAIVMVTHSEDQAARLARRGYVIDDGKLSAAS